jgi:mono/diheme cytochrome c family protein
VVVLKRIGKIVGAVLLVVALAAGGFVTYFPVHAATHPVELAVKSTPERVARGKVIVEALCSGCHYDQNSGGLTGRRMIDAPDEFGVVYSHNITKDTKEGIGSYTDGELTYLLRTGIERDGVYPGPFMAHPHSSDEDIASVVSFLRSDDPWVKAQPIPNRVTQAGLLFKILDHVAWKPSPYPTAPVVAPPATDKVAYGRYLARDVYDCYACHSADFKTMDPEVPEHSKGFFGGGTPTLDSDHHPVLTANLTPDPETGLGKWSEAQFTRALREGFRPDNRPLRYPMEPMPELSNDEASAIWAYLQTVPVIQHPMQRWTDPPPPATASAGEKVYAKYSCGSCHGAAGAGICDLRVGFKKYKDEAGVSAFVHEPQKFIPGTKMPTWKGVILEEEYPPLVAYIKELTNKSTETASAGP